MLFVIGKTVAMTAQQCSWSITLKWIQSEGSGFEKIKNYPDSGDLGIADLSGARVAALLVNQWLLGTIHTGQNNRGVVLGSFH